MAHDLHSVFVHTLSDNFVPARENPINCYNIPSSAVRLWGLACWTGCPSRHLCGPFACPFCRSADDSLLRHLAACPNHSDARAAWAHSCSISLVTSMESSPFAAREGGKHRARLCSVFLWRLAQSSVRERWRLHRWLRMGSFSSSASKSFSWEAPLFRASIPVHSRSDPHVPLFQLSAIFIHVLAEWGLQSAVTAAVPTVVGLTLLSVCFFTI